MALGSTSSSGTLLDLRAIFFFLSAAVVAVTEGAVETGGAGAGEGAGEGAGAGAGA